MKRFENGFISEPAVMSPTNTIADLHELREAKGIKSECVICSDLSPQCIPEEVDLTRSPDCLPLLGLNPCAQVFLSPTMVR